MQCGERKLSAEQNKTRTNCHLLNWSGMHLKSVIGTVTSITKGQRGIEKAGK